MVFDYPAKSGQRRRQGVLDERACEIVSALKRRRGGGEELLAYKEGRRWRDVRSEDINEYLKEATGGDHSAKDFRTWNATALAAVALAVSGESAHTKTARKRAVKRAVDEVAVYLGNTPAVCRASYIDPRVFDAFDARLTIAPALERVAAKLRPGELPIHQPALERAVLDLIDGALGCGRPGAVAPPESIRRIDGPGADAVDDDREQHARDHRPDQQVALAGREHAGLDRGRHVEQRADAAHAEPGHERLLARALELRAGERDEAGQRAHRHDHQRASSQPSQPGSPRPVSVSSEPSSRITDSSSSFSISSAPSCTLALASWSPS